MSFRNLTNKDWRDKTCGCGASAECECGWMCSCCLALCVDIVICPFCQKEVICYKSWKYRSI